MPKDKFVEMIESIELFADRYINITCINLNEETGVKKGYFSYIFTANDILNDDKLVVIKVLSHQVTESYRIKCFERESKILKKIKHTNRCLQIVEEYNTFEHILDEDSIFPSINIKYLVTDYLPIDLEEEFYKEKEIPFLKKLDIFRETVLAIRILHNKDIFHRDLKPDNFRGHNNNKKNTVVAIDFGTANHVKLEKILKEYNFQVGHGMYSSPEAITGLAGEDNISFSTDFYSLGCILFELFHMDLFYYKLESINDSDFSMVLQIIKKNVLNSKDRKETYHKNIDKYCSKIKLPKLTSEYCNIPFAIEKKLNSLLNSLIQLDYRKREDSFDNILSQLDNIKKIYEHDKYCKFKAEKRKIYRINKELKNKRAFDKYNRRSFLNV